MTYHEASGPYTACSIGGDLESPNAVFEAWHQREQLAVNLPTLEAAREVCRQHAITLRNRAAA